MKINIPENAKKVIDQLNNSGFEAYAVGGCVRSAIMGIEPHDWDICTNAKPEQMERVFKDYETHDFGLKHGTLTVMSGGGAFEVTAYRVDGAYSDNRHPEQVTFTDDLTLDLSRRDFTCNAMAYNEKDGIIDPFGGAEDIKKGVLRCVGEPDKRFNEDALRILRGLRFASACGFDIEKSTAGSIHKNAALLNNIANERIRVELLGLLRGDAACKILTEFRDVIAVFIPEIKQTFDFPQRTKHHVYDVWQHIVHSIAAVEQNDVLRMTMLLHDLGKPQACTTDESGFNHFKGHQQISAELAENILKRLRFPNDFYETCLKLIVWHDERYRGSKKQIKRLLNNIGEENTRLLFKVQRADTAAQSEYLRAEKFASIDLAERQMEEILAENQCFDLKSLAVNGSDLKTLGVKEGRAIGELLNKLLEDVIEERVPNDKGALLRLAQKYISK